MSAWLCENGTLSLCADVIKSDSFKKHYDTEHKYCDKSEIELVNILSDINTVNLYYLYPDSDEFNVLENREYIKLDVSNAQRYLSVRSFIYQSCDCDENSENELFDLLNKWAKDYSKIYEDDIDGCEWDIDNPLSTIGVC